MRKEDEGIVSYSLAELNEQRRERGRSNTRPDAPEHALDEQFWRNARVVVPARKTSIHLRVDGDVLEWFRAQARDT